MKLPAIPGMEDFARAARSTRPAGTTATPAAARAKPLTELGDKVVALIGTGATGLQCLPPLAEAAKHVYVFQRTPSAIGVRGNRPTDPVVRRGAASRAGSRRGWTTSRRSCWAGRSTRTSPTTAGRTTTPRSTTRRACKGMTIEEYLRSAEELDFGIMEEHRRGSTSWSPTPTSAAILKPYYRYLCKRPCFHDEYLEAFNRPNVTLVDCPAGIERVTERGPVVDGTQYEVDCLVYGTGFEAELTPLHRRAGHEIVGRGGVTLAEKWADGAASLFGMMSRGFPNLFVMPAPGQQAVVTVNYTQLAVLGAEFVAGTVGAAREAGRQRVRRQRRGRGGLDPEDRRLARRRERGHVGLHAVAHQQRGRSRRR